MRYGRAIRRGLLTAGLAIGFGASPALATTITVNTTADNAPNVNECKGVTGDCSLRQAIDKAASGDTVMVPASAQHYQVTAGEIPITVAPLTIQGAGASSSVIDASGGSSRAFHVTASPASSQTIAFQGVTVTGGKATSMPGGGGILVDFVSNSIEVNLVLSGTAVTGNTSTVTHASGVCCGGGGGIYNASGKVTLTNSSVTHNTATVTFTNTGPFGGSDGGGGIYSQDTVTLNGSEVNNNSANVSTSVVSASCCDGGGGIYGAGGGVVVQPGSQVSTNGFTLNGPLTDPSGAGGGSSGGGGIYDNGTGTTITGSTLDRNTASVNAGDDSQGGGAIYDASSPPLMVLDTTISNNQANVDQTAGPTESGGGGVYTDFDRTPGNSFTNSTISGNSTNASAGTPTQGGGGIYTNAFGGGTAAPTSLANVTIAGNSAPSALGGGIYTDNTAIHPKDSIVALNSASLDADCYATGSGTFASVGHNLTDSPDTCSFTASGDKVLPSNTVGLGPLQNNGGPTFTRALLPGSPAIDAGNPAGCTGPSGAVLSTDQRGFARPDHGESVCDIGAFEFQDPVVPKPRNTGVPKISGAVKAGKTLSCSTGTWNNHPTRFAFQWSRGGTPLVGATHSTYKVQSLDEGSVLTCTVTAFNAGGSASATSKGVKVPVPFVKGCPAATGKLSGTTLGLVHLGMTRAQARHLYSKSNKRSTADLDFFCLTPMGLSAGYPSPKLLKTLSTSLQMKVKGRVVWLETSNPIYSINGIRAGATLQAARQKLPGGNLYHVGQNYWYLAPAGPATAELKVRGGIVLGVGIADKRLTTGTKAQQAFLNSF